MIVEAKAFCSSNSHSLIFCASRIIFCHTKSYTQKIRPGRSHTPWRLKMSVDDGKVMTLWVFYTIRCHILMMPSRRCCTRSAASLFVQLSVIMTTVRISVQLQMTPERAIGLRSWLIGAFTIMICRLLQSCVSSAPKGVVAVTHSLEHFGRVESLSIITQPLQSRIATLNTQ